MQLTHETLFELGQLITLDRDAAERLVIILKASFDISEQGELAISDEQPPIELVDEFHGEPGVSSIRQEAEFGPAKPSTDVILKGSAVARGGRARDVDVSFRLGPVGQRARVFGDRRWEKVIGVTRVSDPEPFESIPLIYERAFGGVDISPPKVKHQDRDPRNPVGCGFQARHSKLDVRDIRVPNIEHPDQRIKKPANKGVPVGFGPVARDWEPRTNWGGTYDERWAQERMPLLPVDFDDRFHNVSPPQLIVPGRLTGGEPIEVRGCTPGGFLAFALPELRPFVEVEFSGGHENLWLECDTVTVDTDEMKLRLVFKGELNVHRKTAGIRSTHCIMKGMRW